MTSVDDDTTGTTAAGIFAFELGRMGPARIADITIADDGELSGGSNLFSGFDLDAIWLSRTPPGGNVAPSDGLGALTFDSAHVRFEPGLLTPYRGDFPDSLRRDRLNGVDADGAVSFDRVTFDSIDSQARDMDGSLSLGEDGRITFTLDTPVATDGLYLYVAERFANDLPELDVGAPASDPGDGTSGDAIGGDGGGDQGSDGETDGTDAGADGDAGHDRADGGDQTDVGGGSTGAGGSTGTDESTGAGGSTGSDGSTGTDDGTAGNSSTRGGSTGGDGGTARDVRLTGTDGDDVITLGTGANAHLAAGNDTIAGRAGNDRLAGAAGRDTLTGGAGADELTGGPGPDIFAGTLADLDGDRIRDFAMGDRIRVTDTSALDVGVTTRDGATTLALSADGGAVATMTLDGLLTGELVAQANGDGGTDLVLEPPARPRVFLQPDTGVTAADGAEILGRADGTEHVIVGDTTRDVRLDANIERLDVPAPLSGLAFAATGSGLTIGAPDADRPTVTVPSLNQPMTLALADGTVTLTQTAPTAYALTGAGDASMTITGDAGAVDLPPGPAAPALAGTAAATGAPANVFLGHGGHYELADAARVFGQADSAESVTLGPSASDVRFDANIERINLPSTADALTFDAGPHGLAIREDGATLATIASLNQTTTLSFPDGLAMIRQTGPFGFDLVGADGTDATIDADGISPDVPLFASEAEAVELVGTNAMDAWRGMPDGGDGA